ncbi:hypothetical protein HispidOSU_006214 [Sigmodon hispidus]
MACTGSGPALTGQASRRALTRKPLQAGPRPRADGFMTLLPEAALRTNPRALNVLFGDSALRHFRVFVLPEAYESRKRWYPDSARKRPAFRRMFEERFRGAWAFRRPRRSVSVRSRASGPACCWTAVRRLAWLQAAVASCLSGRSQCVSWFPERQ